VGEQMSVILAISKLLLTMHLGIPARHVLHARKTLVFNQMQGKKWCFTMLKLPSDGAIGDYRI
jgi:hypothetical protein